MSNYIVSDCIVSDCAVSDNPIVLHSSVYTSSTKFPGHNCHLRRPRGVVDFIEMSDAAADVAAVLAADTTDLLSSAKAADGSCFFPAIT